jgi:hypothetical protein
LGVCYFRSASLDPMRLEVAVPCGYLFVGPTLGSLQVLRQRSEKKNRRGVPEASIAIDGANPWIRKIHALGKISEP